MLGMSYAQLVALVSSLDPNDLPEGRDRTQLQAVLAFFEAAGGPAGLNDVIDDHGR